MANKIISIDITPNSNDEYNANAGVMWEHNATVLKFNISEDFVGDYRYYIEYRSLMGTKVRTEFLELDSRNNTVTYSVPAQMSALKGVECWFNIVSIDGDGNTQQVIKSPKFCLSFDYSPDTDNHLCKVNDFSINSLLEAIRLGTFKGDKGDKGDQGDKGDKGETGGISEDFATRSFANSVKGRAKGDVVTINDISPVKHPISIKINQKNLWNNGDVTVTNHYIAVNLNETLRAGEAYTLTADVESTDTDDTTCLIINNTNNNEQLGLIERGERKALTFTLKGDCKTLMFYSSTSYPNSADDTATFKNIQLELGKTATEYTPYMDLTATKVKICGKNLLDGRWELGAINSSTGEKTSNSTSIRTVSYIPVKPNTAYHFSLTDDASYFPYSYDANCNFVAYKGMKKGKFYLNMADNEHYLIIVQYGNVTPPVNAQIEIGTVATEYEEYKGIEEYTPSSEGVVENAFSFYPTTTVFSDAVGTAVECEYSKDINKVIENLEKAIILLGGSV